MPMQVRMEEDEKALFAELLGKARSFVEFGCGGSTVFASGIVDGPIISLDSSRAWLDQVAAACAATPDRPPPRLHYVDIGPTGDWGVPTDPQTRERWPSYATSVWTLEGAYDGDLYLVDGRFRVSCFMEALLRCRADAIVAIHDFAQRAEYHVVREFADEIATASTLSAFRRRTDFDMRHAMRVIDVKRYHWG